MAPKRSTRVILAALLRVCQGAICNPLQPRQRQTPREAVAEVQGANPISVNLRHIPFVVLDLDFDLDLAAFVFAKFSRAS